MDLHTDGLDYAPPEEADGVDTDDSEGEKDLEIEEKRQYFRWDFRLEYFLIFRTSQEELDEETAALHREAEMSVDELRKMYANVTEYTQSKVCMFHFYVLFVMHVPSYLTDCRMK